MDKYCSFASLAKEIANEAGKPLTEEQACSTIICHIDSQNQKIKILMDEITTLKESIECMSNSANARNNDKMETGDHESTQGSSDKMEIVAHNAKRKAEKDAESVHPKKPTTTSTESKKTIKGEKQQATAKVANKDKVKYAPSIAISNRFDSLGDNQQSSTSDEPKNETAPRHAAIPPMFIETEDTNMFSILIEKYFTKKVLIKIHPDQISIKPQNQEDETILKTFLEENNIKYFTFNTSANRPRQAVLKYIPNDVTKETIIDGLQRQNIHPIKVTRIKNKDGEETKIVQVTINKQDSEKIYKLEHVNNLKIKVEPFRRKTGPTQCFKCQRFGHSSYTCHLTPMCVKCGKSHEKTMCQRNDKQGDKLMCANCKGDHPANYRGCPAYKEKLTQLKAKAAAKKNNDNTENNNNTNQENIPTLVEDSSNPTVSRNEDERNKPTYADKARSKQDKKGKTPDQEVKEDLPDAGTTTPTETPLAKIISLVKNYLPRLKEAKDTTTIIMIAIEALTEILN